MPTTGAITEYIDVAQLVLYLFWIFFFSLILWLRREDKREGYPLDHPGPDRIRVEGFPGTPSPKTFRMLHGEPVDKPSGVPDSRPVAAEPTAVFNGAPLEPTGNPMLDGVGPAAYADRPDVPDHTLHGDPRIVPMRVASGFHIEPRDPDPRGMDVIGADGQRGAVVSDLWVDRSEPQARYLELDVTVAGGQRKALVPITLARVDRARGVVHVKSITSEQFADVPATRNPELITMLEEERICAYYGGGNLYAMPERSEPLV